MSRTVDYRWHLRLRMAERGMFATTELGPLLAERGVVLSREQVYRLAAGTPERLSLHTLAALCDILDCTPADLIEPVIEARSGTRHAVGAKTTQAETEHALRLAEPFGNTYGLALARWAHGSVLLRSADPRRDAGFELLRLSRSAGMGVLGSVLEADLAVAVALDDQRHSSIDDLCAVVRAEIEAGEVLLVLPAAGTLVELLVARGTPDDVAQTHDVVARFEALRPQDPEPAVQLWQMQWHARLAGAEGDASAYTETVIRYRNLAQRLDARGHLAVAKQLATEPAFRSRA